MSQSFNVPGAFTSTIFIPPGTRTAYIDNVVFEGVNRVKVVEFFHTWHNTLLNNIDVVYWASPIDEALLTTLTQLGFRVIRHGLRMFAVLRRPVTPVQTLAPLRQTVEIVQDRNKNLIAYVVPFQKIAQDIAFYADGNGTYHKELQQVQQLYLPEHYKRPLEDGTFINPCMIYDECEGYVVTLWHHVRGHGLSYIGHAVCIPKMQANQPTETPPYVMEIYDVHIVETYRGLGFGKLLLRAIQANTTADFLWLGILKNNPAFQRAAGLYASSDFLFPSSVQTLLKDRTEEAVALLHIKGAIHMFDRNALLKEINMERQLQCIIIPPDMLVTLYKTLNNDREVSGVFDTIPDAVVTELRIHHDAQPIKPAEKLVSSFGITQTGDPHTHTVEIDYTNPYSFHTHPAKCYSDNNCYLGWPSAQDMANMIFYWDKVRSHLVVTCEGIYHLQLTAAARRWCQEKGIYVQNSYEKYLKQLEHINILRFNQGVPPINNVHGNANAKFHNSVARGNVSSATMSFKLRHRQFLEFINSWIIEDSGSPTFHVAFYAWEEVGLRSKTICSCVGDKPCPPLGAVQSLPIFVLMGMGGGKGGKKKLTKKK